MSFDSVLAGVRLPDREGLSDIAVRDGTIAAIAPSIETDAPHEDGMGCLAISGFVETHIHLDKAMILDRCPICEGTLAEAISTTAAAKAAFTVNDVHARAARTIEMAILQGTTRMRSFVEVDPRAGYRSLEALVRIKQDYAFAIDLELCAFAQEGLTQEPETADMLRQALDNGADLVGGCPYTDKDPVAHVSAIFDIAERYDVAVDFHADFDLDPENSILPEIVRQTERRGFGGRVSAGHVTKLSAMPPAQIAEWGRRLADSGVALTILPATDLFLTGRSADHLVPRGVAPALTLADAGATVSLASNNILNPFTPFGDASLCRIANLFANIAQAGSDADLDRIFAMVTGSAARLMNAPYGLAVGRSADIILVDAESGSDCIRRIAPVLAGWKRGVKTLERGRARLLRPARAEGAARP